MIPFIFHASSREKSVMESKRERAYPEVPSSIHNTVWQEGQDETSGLQKKKHSSSHQALDFNIKSDGPH